MVVYAITARTHGPALYLVQVRKRLKVCIGSGVYISPQLAQIMPQPAQW